ncbi:uncharacterized protein B0H18DRAFT_1118781 [Fomitopsis serialis]|uniref:uncharacterized protein n=1 Tax=Fomitopsis serialis TaxID=139415 RepID=UPI002008912E|nr:uncharacterized protein B0H18DRAFT_1118781 [Neoantrodia serialis]KAH9926708.1 hypothetical protein B0H18DRAFT_1118781 [Neoantrodia serialis]
MAAIMNSTLNSVELDSDDNNVTGIASAMTELQLDASEPEHPAEMQVEHSGLVPSARVQRIVDRYRPMKKLPETLVPGPYRRPFKLYFGWESGLDTPLNYLRRTQTVAWVPEYNREFIGGQEWFRYGDVTDEQLQDANYKKVLRSWSWFDFPQQLQTRYKIDLEEVPVVSQSNNEVVALWSNYTEKTRRREIKRQAAVGLKQLIK